MADPGIDGRDVEVCDEISIRRAQVQDAAQLAEMRQDYFEEEVGDGDVGANAICHYFD